MKASTTIDNKTNIHVHDYFPKDDDWRTVKKRKPLLNINVPDILEII